MWFDWRARLFLLIGLPLFWPVSNQWDVSPFEAVPLSRVPQLEQEGTGDGARATGTASGPF